MLSKIIGLGWRTAVAVASLAAAALALGGCMTSGGPATVAGQPASVGVDPPPQGPTAVALNEMLKLDYFSTFCVSPVGRHSTIGPETLRNIDQCLARSVLPSDCAEYRSSIRKLARLAVLDRSFNILLPSVARLLNDCPAARGARHKGRADADVAQVSVLDVALIFARKPTSDPQVPVAPYRYLTAICERAVSPDSRDARLSELLLCSEVETGGPRPSRDNYVKWIETSLGGADDSD